MGQYYKAILSIEPLNAQKFIDNKLNVFCLESNMGVKLMEHSWKLNPFVFQVELRLKTPHHIIWAGDYADPAPEFPSYIYQEKEYGQNWYSMVKDKINYINSDLSLLEFQTKYPFLVNHTKKTYTTRDLPNIDGWVIHPLPLLTCDGNGRGMGDYRRSYDKKAVGSWAKDKIQVMEIPPEDYKEEFFYFKED